MPRIAAVGVEIPATAIRGAGLPVSAVPAISSVASSPSRRLRRAQIRGRGRPSRRGSNSGPGLPKSANVRQTTTQLQRRIASYVPPQAYAPRVRAALEGLGYQIIPVATRGHFEDDSWEPDLRIVDERHIDRIPAEDYLPRTPVVLLTGEARETAWRDRRVVGSVIRPAMLKDLYPILQRALEDTPRVAARVPAELPGRCTQSDRRWMGAVVSLSENGCLFRTGESVATDQQLNLLFPLPMGQMITARVRAVGQQGQSVGMVFDNIAPRARESVARYVEERLATL